MIQRFLALITTLICSCICDVGVCQTQPNLDWLTESERQWLVEHPKIRVAPTPDYPPFEYWNEAGEFQGVVSSYLDYFSTELGIEFELVRTKKWSENLAQLEAREIDAVSLLVPWSDRKYVAFSKPYVSYPALIIVRKDGPGSLQLRDLEGKRVAVPSGYTGQHFLEMAYPEINVVRAKDPADGVKMLAKGEVDAFFGGSSVVSYIATKQGISSLRVAGETDFVYANCFGVRSDWSEFAGIITKALDRMTPRQHRDFRDPWIMRDFFFKKQFYEFQSFWWILASVLTVLVSGTGFVVVWNRKQAVLIDELEAAKQQTEIVNQQLDLARREAESANLAKSSFVANISHEIRTPMNGVLGMCELLRGTELDETQIDYLDLANSSAENLMSLINDVLDISKIEAGELQLEMRPFSVDETLNDAIDLLNVKAAKKGLKILLDRSEDVEHFYLGDQLRIRQILLNLLSNAVKFTERGEIQICVKRSDNDPPSNSVGTSEASDGTHLIRFEVKDSGAGIPPERVDAIFEPFKQEDVTIARRHGGTGLGLSICKTLAEMMGGSADVRSVLGQGSVFGFTARLIPTDAPLIEPERMESGPVLNGRQVLLVEDGLVNQRVAIGLLEKRGHHVDLVESGEQALDALQKNEYDVVLMDIELPVMNGVTAVGRIRQREQGTGRHQWVVAMTGHAMRGDKEKFISAGMDDHLVKPYKPNELYTAVEQPVNNNRPGTTNSIPILDEAAALETAGGDAELVDLLRETCLQEAPNIIAQAKVAVSEQDWKSARRSGHSLRSTFGAVGAMSASATSAQLEMVAEEDAAKFSTAIEAVELAFQQFVDKLKS